MNFQEVETFLMPALIGALVLFMIFIIYDLTKQSNPGKFGSFILYAALGLGVLGFLIKAIIYTVV